MNTQQLTKHETFTAILAEAYAAADLAQAGKVEDLNAFDCGFAWVTIDGTSPLARWCRQQSNGERNRQYGSKGYPTGWQFWCPGNFNGQSIGIHEAGAKAFQDVLALKYNIRADVGSRYD